MQFFQLGLVFKSVPIGNVEGSWGGAETLQMAGKEEKYGIVWAGQGGKNATGREKHGHRNMVGRAR